MYDVVDEAFCLLDEESLEQAIKALAGLTEGNKLVGIISHVGELKERIDRQIIVTKEKPEEVGRRLFERKLLNRFAKKEGCLVL